MFLYSIKFFLSLAFFISIILLPMAEIGWKSKTANMPVWFVILFATTGLLTIATFFITIMIGIWSI